MKLEEKRILDISYTLAGILFYYLKKILPDKWITPKSEVKTVSSKSDLKNGKIEYSRPINYFDVELSSSGTTGEPTTVFSSPLHWISEQSIQYEYFKSNGYRIFDKMIIVRGYSPKPGQPIIKHERLRNFYWVSPFHLTEVNSSEIKELMKGRYFLRGYPSSLYLLANLLAEKKFEKPETIFTASETLTAQKRNRIESVFGTKVMDWYGTSEPAILAYQNEKSYPGYHVPESHCKLLPKLLSASGQHEIVACAIFNRLSKLGYYKTGDLAIFKNGRIHSIEGRKSDILELEKSKIPLTNFYTQFYNVKGITEFQIVKKPEKLVFIYRGNVSNYDLENLTQKLRNRLVDHPFCLTQSEQFHMSSGGKKPVFVEVKA